MKILIFTLLLLFVSGCIDRYESYSEKDYGLVILEEGESDGYWASNDFFEIAQYCREENGKIIDRLDEWTWKSVDYTESNEKGIFICQIRYTSQLVYPPQESDPEINSFPEYNWDRKYINHNFGEPFGVQEIECRQLQKDWQDLKQGDWICPV